MLKIRLLPKENCIEIAKKYYLLELKCDPQIVATTSEAELLDYLPTKLFGQEFTVNKQVTEYGLTWYYITDTNWCVPAIFVEQVYSDLLTNIQ